MVRCKNEDFKALFIQRIYPLSVGECMDVDDSCGSIHMEAWKVAGSF